MSTCRARQRRGERGQAVVLMAVIAAVLMGFLALSLDVGRAYITRVRAQNAADAAALAGAEYLPFDATVADEGTAQLNATSTLSYNGLTAENSTIAITFSDAGATWPNEVHVSVRRTIPNYFAGVLGRPTTTIAVTAVAVANGDCATNSLLSQCSPPGLCTQFDDCSAIYRGLMPFGLCENTVSNAMYMQAITLKQGSGNNGNMCTGGGNFAPVDLDYTKSGNPVTGSKQYEHDIALGAPTGHVTGDWLTTETGNMVGPTTTGLEGMLSNCTQALSASACATMVVIVPVIGGSIGSVNGKSAVEIAGFALVQIRAADIQNLTASSNSVPAVAVVAFIPTDEDTANPGWDPSLAVCNAATNTTDANGIVVGCPPPASWADTRGTLV